MHLGCALTCLALAFTGVSAGFSSSAPEQAWNVVSPQEKDLYVDLSLRASTLVEGSDYCLTYIAGEIQYPIALSPLADGIYKTEEKLEPTVLALSNAHFTVRAYLDETELFAAELVDHPFYSAQYDYVCLDAEGGVEGYGHYGGPKENPGATYETQRIFLYNGNQYFYGEDAWGTPCVNAVGYFDQDKSFVAVKMAAIANAQTELTYHYADIPYDVSSVYFLRLSASEGHSYLHYLATPIEALTYGVCYFAGTSEYRAFKTIVTSAVHGASAGLLGAVVESYLTYGKADSNGATTSTVSNIFSTWFENKSATNEDLKATKIADYTGYSGNGNSYEGLTKNGWFSVNEKWNTMCSQAGIDPKTGKARSNFLSFFDISNPIFLVILIVGSGLLISVLVMLYLLKRRKARDS